MQARFFPLLVLLPVLGQPPSPPPAPRPTDQAIVIVNPGNPLQDIKQADLKKILSLQVKHWPHKDRIQLYLPKTGSKAQRILLKKVFKMNIKKLKRYFAKLLYTNKISSKPKTAGTIKSIKMVMKKKGGIAVIMRSALPKGIKVKILKVEGKAPGDKGYPLQ
ncbi:MAG TPA: hypothetical protein ENK02_11650 [Planctomycetes bacterium]|nr:hypothetical protein [Planctomycetota bacterium]